VQTREYERMKSRVMDELRKTFSPEFLNRLDDVVVFHALTAAQIREIVELELRPVRERLAARGLVLTVSEALEEHLGEVGYDPSMGARPLRRAVRREIEDPLAEQVLRWEGEFGEILAEWDAERGEVTFELIESGVSCTN